MFFAGLAEVHEGLEMDERDGFVIITAASDEGMVDIHDRKPLVLSPQHAREWVDPDTPPERARELAMEQLQSLAWSFHWYKGLARMWGRFVDQGAHLIQPLSLASDVDD